MTSSCPQPTTFKTSNSSANRELRPRLNLDECYADIPMNGSDDFIKRGGLELRELDTNREHESEQERHRGESQRGTSGVVLSTMCRSD